MKSFPDESQMERSQDGSEFIRGGSIGINRILSRFVERSRSDTRPEFTAVLISAMTVFRNIYATYRKDPAVKLEDAFVKDISLFLEYYDTYLSFARGAQLTRTKCPVVVYFPVYNKVPEQIRRTLKGNKLEESEAYAKFLRLYHGRDELMQTLENIECFWTMAGETMLPHQEVARKFRQITGRRQCGYTSGDDIALISHIPLDFHLAARLRGIFELQSYTGRRKDSEEFRLRLDEDGRVPFNTTTHVVFGDKVMIKPMFTPKQAHALLEQADRERWVTRTEDDIRHRIAKATGVLLKDLRRYDFV